MTKKCLNSWSQKGWCNKPTKLQFQTILMRKILMLSNATNQPKSIRCIQSIKLTDKRTPDSKRTFVLSVADMPNTFTFENAEMSPFRTRQFMPIFPRDELHVLFRFALYRFLATFVDICLGFWTFIMARGVHVLLAVLEGYVVITFRTAPALGLLEVALPMCSTASGTWGRIVHVLCCCTMVCQIKRTILLDYVKHIAAAKY